MCHQHRAAPYGNHNCSSCGSTNSSCHSTCSPGYGCHNSCQSGYSCRSICSHGDHCGRCRPSCLHGNGCVFSNGPGYFYNKGPVPTSHACSKAGCTPNRRCGRCMQGRRNVGFIYVPLAIMTGGLSCAVVGIARGLQRRQADKALAQAQYQEEWNLVSVVDGEKSGIVGNGNAEAIVDGRADPPAYADATGDDERRASIERWEKKGF